MKKQEGFTLIELLIVVAIIAIIAAIAVPNLLDARRAANETAGIAALRSLGSAQTSYSVENGRFGTLTELKALGLVDGRFGAGGNISGYEITEATTAVTTDNGTVLSCFLDGTPATVCGYNAEPESESRGRYKYMMGTDLVVRYNSACPDALAADGCKEGSPIGGKTTS